MDCWTSGRKLENWSQQQHLLVTAKGIVQATKLAASRGACREVLAMLLPSSQKAANSCLNSWGRESLHLFWKSHRLKSYLPSNAC